MHRLPQAIATAYRIATDHEIHLWSYGQLTSPRNPATTTWQERRRTLDDQAIFGPLQDFACACGKYPKEEWLIPVAPICTICGVKATTRAVRRKRFGHIAFPFPVPHPVATAQSLTTFPVLPAAIVESHRGNRLAPLYDELVQSLSSGAHERITAVLASLVEVVLPALLVAVAWNLQDAPTLARGMALEGRDVLDGTERCSCSYPLEGLDVPRCPGCGMPLKRG